MRFVMNVTKSSNLNILCKLNPPEKRKKRKKRKRRDLSGSESQPYSFENLVREAVERYDKMSKCESPSFVMGEK